MSSDTTNVVLAIMAGTPPTMVAMAGLWQALKMGVASKGFYDEAIMKLAETTEHVRLVEAEIAQNRYVVLRNSSEVTEQLKELKITSESLAKAREIINQNYRQLQENSKVIGEIGNRIDVILDKLEKLYEITRQHESQKKIEITKEGYGAMG